jgi:hypothetical protein
VNVSVVTASSTCRITGTIAADDADPAGYGWAMLTTVVMTPRWVPSFPTVTRVARTKAAVVGPRAPATTGSTIGSWKSLTPRVCAVSRIGAHERVTGSAKGTCRLTLTAAGRPGAVAALTRSWTITVF